MVDLGRLVWCFVAGLFRSRAALQAEILVLRHQLNVLRHKSPKRLAFSNIDRLVFTGLYGLTPSVLNALKILKPATVIAWHRAGFRAYWRWKSRPRGGRPKASLEARALIREMSIANPLWGAPRVMVSCSSSVSMSARPPWPSTWPGKDGRPRRAGRPFFAIMRTASSPWTCLLCRVWSALRAIDSTACAPGAAVAGRNHPSERPMDRTAIDRSVWLEGVAALSYSRSRLRLWRGVRSAYQGYRHSRPADLGAFALAERIRGEAHWLDPAGLP